MSKEKQITDELFDIGNGICELLNTSDDVIHTCISNLNKRFPNVDFEIIVNRIKQYGNNFPDMSSMLSNKFKKIEFSPKDVADILVILKESRKLKDPNNDDTNIDLINYKWIADNYDVYTLLVEIVEISKHIQNVMNNYHKLEKHKTQILDLKPSKNVLVDSYGNEYHFLNNVCEPD